MISNRLVDVRIGWWAVFLLALACGPMAQAADCPGHPDAIGTWRTLVVDPHAHPRLGTMQYPETLPLRDHEVVLTFDDGPLPKNSNQVLQTLADNCVKATFFTIGEQARANPEGVRKLAAAGHTIGTHSQTHPLTFHKMNLQQAQKQIDDGIDSTLAAVDDPSDLAPFFRFPGLLRSDVAEGYLASKGIQVWSTDLLADDWHHISSAAVYDLAVRRLEARGKGILLLHDIQARTAAALPKILQTLKARGFHIVHVVPATPEQPATPTEPADWQLYPPSETVPIARWPKVPSFTIAEAEGFVAPALSDFDTPDGRLLLSAEPFARMKRRSSVRLPMEASWARAVDLPIELAAVLPVPDQTLFELPKDAAAAFRSHPPHGASVAESEMEGYDKKASAGKKSGARSHVAHGAGRSGRLAHAAQKPGRHPAHVNGGAKRPVRVASLKKR